MSSQKTPLIEINDLKVYFPVYDGMLFRRHIGDVKAVDSVRLHVDKGETLGLVGESGCGKSTLGRAIVHLNHITQGEIWYYDEADLGQNIGKLRAHVRHRTPAGKMNLANLSNKDFLAYRREIQMIFQDPFSSLNPRMTVYDLVREPMDVHRLYDNESEVQHHVERLLEAVGIDPSMQDRYPSEFSGGQRQRIGIARALAVEPSFIVCDEPIAALDVSIQAQIINLLEDLQAELGLAYLFIAHDLSMVRHISHRVAVMYLGKIVEQAHVDDLYEDPLHPYTQALLDAMPVPDPTVNQLAEQNVVSGELPSPLNPPKGCNFCTRCPKVMDICHEVEPVFQEVKPDHWAACHLHET